MCLNINFRNPTLEEIIVMVLLQCETNCNVDEMIVLIVILIIALLKVISLIGCVTHHFMNFHGG